MRRMRKIDALSERLHQLTKWDSAYLFLVMNMIFWMIIAGVTGVIGGYLYDHTLNGKGLFLLCWLGYITVFIGFFGGIIYLYRKE